jgi:hypothetical protein
MEVTMNIPTPRAIAYLESGQVKGKVVISVVNGT